MSTYQPSPFVEPLGYQPVEFHDIPPTTESIGTEEFVSTRHVSKFSEHPEPFAHADTNTLHRVADASI